MTPVCNEVLLMAALNSLERAVANTQFALRTLHELKKRNPALAAGSRRAKTAKQAECEASQSGPKGNAK